MKLSPLFFLSLFSFLACQQESSVKKAIVDLSDPIDVSMLHRGEALYKNNCLTCHGANRSTPPQLGPEIWGSSKELIRSKVVLNSYPKGYKPKASTNLMATQSLDKSEIQSLFIFLNYQK